MSNRGTGEQQQHWDQSELGECPQFSGQSGRRVVKRGEKREGGRTARWCGDLCVLRVVFTASFRKYVRLNNLTSGSYLTQRIICWLGGISGHQN